jgi:hypothetical protein
MGPHCHIETVLFSSLLYTFLNQTTFLLMSPSEYKSFRLIKYAIGYPFDNIEYTGRKELLDGTPSHN